MNQRPLALIVAVTLILPFTPLGRIFGFKPLPISFLLLIRIIVMGNPDAIRPVCVPLLRIASATCSPTHGTGSPLVRVVGHHDVRLKCLNGNNKNRLRYQFSSKGWPCLLGWQAS
jgi:hypothetical protein